MPQEAGANSENAQEPNSTNGDGQPTGGKFPVGLILLAAIYICAISIWAALPNSVVNLAVRNAVESAHVLIALLQDHGMTGAQVHFPRELLRKSGDVIQYGVLWLLLVLLFRGRWRSLLAWGATVVACTVNESEHLWGRGRMFELSDVVLTAAIWLAPSLLLLLRARPRGDGRVGGGG